MMQKLFDHMEQEHGLILTESELQDIVSAAGLDNRELVKRLFEELDAANDVAAKLRAALEYVRDNHHEGEGALEGIVNDALEFDTK